MPLPCSVMTVEFGTPFSRLIIPSWLKRCVTSAPTSIIAIAQWSSLVKKTFAVLLNTRIIPQTAARPHSAMNAGL